MPARIEIIKGDIAKLEIEAIVNAANNSLLGGGGVDGAIHRAAGPGLLEECRKLGGCTSIVAQEHSPFINASETNDSVAFGDVIRCDTGEAKITKGHNLPAKWVIHTVGPVWKGGGHGEDELLASCYRNSLKLAVENGIHEVAFPSISTGAYGFPLERAAKIAITEIGRFIDSDVPLELVVIVCFNERVQLAYEKALVNYEK